MSAASSLDARVAAARAGDQQAHDDALAEVRHAVVGYLLARRVPDQDAQDIAQDVCLTVLKVLPDWQPTGRSLWGYVFATVRSRLVDRARAHGRHGHLSVEGLPEVVDETPGPEQQALAAEGNAQMAALIARLSPMHRDIVVLRVVVGLSTAETAAALCLATGSVHVLQHRAIGRLRAMLADQASVAAADDTPTATGEWSA